MTATGAPQRHLLVHQLLHHAHALLAAAADSEALPLASLLARAVDHLPAEDRADLDPPARARLTAEAAAQLLACTRTPIRPQDPHLESCLRALDRLPRAARTGLLAVAAQRTTPGLDSAAPPAACVPAPVGSPARGRAAGRCPCACNSGGFCGGCGHAGCGGRR
ncbi:hypothetical protein GTY44_22240 [Streptomyces sp. SID5914]|nr:hypothetical protein [Streptomyces sp. SID5914]MZG16173.1 hypothetical protein [Streptomyces sp. SID5914]